MLWQYYNYSNYVYRHVCILVTAYIYIYCLLPLPVFHTAARQSFCNILHNDLTLRPSHTYHSMLADHSRVTTLAIL